MSSSNVNTVWTGLLQGQERDNSRNVEVWDTRLVRHLTIYVGFIVLLATTYRQWRDCN